MSFDISKLVSLFVEYFKKQKINFAFLFEYQYNKYNINSQAFNRLVTGIVDTNINIFMMNVNTIKNTTKNTILKVAREIFKSILSRCYIKIQHSLMISCRVAIHKFYDFLLFFFIKILFIISFN